MSVGQAVILVGGRGERLNDGVRFAPAVETPKPLIEVGGKPFLTYSINMLKGIGVKDIVLLVGYRKELYESLRNDVVRLVETQEDVNKAVLSIPNLQDLFILLNGDCFPVMDWRDFINTNLPRVAIKIIGRDAGIAVVRKGDVVGGKVRCDRIGDILSNNAGSYEAYTMLGGLHIGTYQGLERARMFFDIVVFGA
jgi:NDP-sugar pyrophosphorylase family protein